MPDAAASFDYERPQASGARRPARAAPRGKAGRAGKGGKGARSPRAGLSSSLPRYGAIAISVMIGVGIVVNALMMQHGHHPAPLFAAAPAKPAVSVAAIVAAKAPPTAAVKPVAPAPVSADGGEAPTATASIPTGAKHPAAHPAPHPIRQARADEDAIARLIGGASGAPAHRHKSADKDEPGKGGNGKAAAGRSAPGRAGN